MAGVKGRSGGSRPGTGGTRPGAGRKKTLAKVSEEFRRKFLTTLRREERAAGHTLMEVLARRVLDVEIRPQDHRGYCKLAIELLTVPISETKVDHTVRTYAPLLLPMMLDEPVRTLDLDAEPVEHPGRDEQH
jgi:hypothetical protein